MSTFIKPCQGYLNSFYGPRVHPITGVKGTFHRGIDYTGADDNTIVAAAAGKVRFLDNSTNRTGFGRYIIITHDNGYETVYSHLASISVQLGQRVKQGQKIGVKGTTGNSTGMHLHFEMSKGRWVNTYANNVDPLPFIDDPEIRTVQSVLKELGLYNGAIDGIHGSASIAAVKVFQTRKGMVADGVPGRGTMAAILALKKEQEKAPAAKPVAKPATSIPNEKEEEITVDQLLQFSTNEGKNALLIVLKRFEQKDPALSTAWREKLEAKKFTIHDAIEVIFVAVYRGYITGLVNTDALQEKVEALEKLLAEK